MCPPRPCGSPSQARQRSTFLSIARIRSFTVLYDSPALNACLGWVPLAQVRRHPVEGQPAEPGEDEDQIHQRPPQFQQEMDK